MTRVNKSVENRIPGLAAQSWVTRQTLPDEGQKPKPPVRPGVGIVRCIWNCPFRTPASAQSESEIPHDLEIQVGIRITAKQC